MCDEPSIWVSSPTGAVDNPPASRGCWSGMERELQGKAGWIYRKVLRHPLLPAFLKLQDGAGPPIRVGWGLRPSGRAALRASERTGDRLLLLEDAFVRSIRPGGGTVYGLIADSQGIHYAADGKSDLFEALDSGTPAGWMMRDMADGDDPVDLMKRFRETGASKYNWFPGEYRDEPLPDQEGILVVDQSRGDAAIRYGGLGIADFDRMLRDALDEGGPVYVRAHPDHLYRKKHSCFPPALLADSRVKLLSPDSSPAQCFSFCHTVFVGSSLMGMEALIHGKKVVTYGRPFFAGRGLTDDRAIGMKPGKAVALTGLFEAAYLRYAHYFDPDAGAPCGLGVILEHLALQKDMFRRNRGHSVVVGFSPWKRNIVPAYLRSPAGKLTFLPTPSSADPHETDSRMAVWGRKQETPAAWRNRFVRIEDGFIRSRGLGAAFNFPYSWVVDESGIYFDGSAVSDLEKILNAGFTQGDLDEAAELIALLRKLRLTKYNLGGERVSLDENVTKGRKIILVPGQVEADASIAFGSPEVKSNLSLLQRVRAAEPDAFLLFKAHPDLVAGTRHGSLLPPELTAACDMAVTEGNVLDWLDLCDEVHTMTSTVGFEALIREVPVTTYGLPFYAGWGLTTDRLSCARRSRRLNLAELVCGALIKYPRYLNPATGEFTTALKAVRVLTSDAAAGDRRAWHLKTISALKKLWVGISRG